MSVKFQQTRPNSDKSEAIKIRKELLVFGWIRNNHKNVPLDIMQIIKLFSHDAHEWLIQGKKFQELFKRYHNNYRWLFTSVFII